MVAKQGGSEAPNHSPSLPTAQSMQVLPLPLEPHKAEPIPQMTLNNYESDQGDDGLLEEEINNVLGISLSKEQTRLMSPTTSAAAKKAAIDYKRDWDFLDGTEEDDAGENLQQRPPSFLKQSQLVSHLPLHIPKPLEDAVVQHESALPSPWTATPKVFETPRENQRIQNIQNSRPRASTGPSGMLGDLNVRRLLSSLGLPTSIDPRPSRELSLPRLPTILGGANETNGNEKILGRSNRSSSVYIPRFPWTSSTQTRRSRESSPEPRSDNVKTPRSNRPGSASFSHVQPQPQSSTESRSDNCAVVSQQPRVPNICQASSDEPNRPQTALSKVSSLGDDTRWENVQGQVNSRMKAIVDSFQDSNIKLPSFPNLNLGALRPDFTHKRTFSDIKAQIHAAKQGASLENQCESDIGHPNGQTLNSEAKPSQLQKSPKSVHNFLDDALTCLTGDIVIMGGYRGSILRSADPPHRQLWVPVKVGLNIRKVNLEVGLEPEDEDSMEDTIFASGMLTHIGPVDMSRRLLKRLRSCPNAQEGKLRVHDYGYDWRLSPHLLSRRLVKYLEGLECNTACKPGEERGATIIAHSLGGLITRHAVNQRPELFAGVVYAGVPQYCVNILGPLRNGDEVLLSSKVLTAQVNFTLRTSFVLLPESGECFIDKETRERYPVDFFNVQDWKDNAFSPCIAPALPALGQPEKKSLFGTVSGSLPSLIGKIGSTSFTSSKESGLNDAVSNAADTVAIKAEDIAHPNTRGLNMQMGQSGQSGQSGCVQSSAVSTIPIPAALAYLERTLAATLAFKHELAFDPQHCSANAYPPLATIYSTSTPTVYGARVSGREGIRRTDAYDNLVFASGDGVVLARAAMLPKGYTVAEGGKVRTERGHVGLLGDLQAAGKCLGAVARARKGGVGLGISMPEEAQEAEGD